MGWYAIKRNQPTKTIYVCWANDMVFFCWIRDIIQTRRILVSLQGMKKDVLSLSLSVCIYIYIYIYIYIKSTLFIVLNIYFFHNIIFNTILKLMQSKVFHSIFLFRWMYCIFSFIRNILFLSNLYFISVPLTEL